MEYINAIIDERDEALTRLAASEAALRLSEERVANAEGQRNVLYSAMERIVAGCTLPLNEPAMDVIVTVADIAAAAIKGVPTDASPTASAAVKGVQ